MPLDPSTIVMIRPHPEIAKLASYVHGLADGLENSKLFSAYEWLDKLSRNTCRHGYIGCPGGMSCTSDHK